MHGKLERDTRTHGIAHDIDRTITQTFQQISHIGALIDQAELAGAERRTAVAVKIDGNHLTVFSQERQQGSNMSIEPSPPWRRSSGSPLPVIS